MTDQQPPHCPIKLCAVDLMGRWGAPAQGSSQARRNLAVSGCQSENNGKAFYSTNGDRLLFSA